MSAKIGLDIRAVSLEAMFRRLHFYYFRPFWPCSGGCIFIIFGRFGHEHCSCFVNWQSGMVPILRACDTIPAVLRCAAGSCDARNSLMSHFLFCAREFPYNWCTGQS